MDAPPSYDEQFGPVEVGLRSDLVFVRQRMSGRARYIVHDPVSFQSHVLSVFEYQVATGIVAHRSLSDNYDKLVERGIIPRHVARLVLRVRPRSSFEEPAALADQPGGHVVRASRPQEGGPTAGLVHDGELLQGTSPQPRRVPHAHRPARRLVVLAGWLRRVGDSTLRRLLEVPRAIRRDVRPEHRHARVVEPAGDVDLPRWPQSDPRIWPRLCVQTLRRGRSPKSARPSS